MTAQEVVAANLRARVAWNRISQPELARLLGWSNRTVQNKLYGMSRFTEEDLVRLAELFGLEDPGVFFRMPEGFAISGSSSAWIQILQVRTPLRLVA